MLSPKEAVARVSSRLNRLSASLPRLNTYSNKLHKDKDPPRPATSLLIPQTHEQPSFEALSPPPPPSRAAPPAPTAPLAPPVPPAPIPHHTKKPSNGAVTPWHLQTPPPESLGSPTSATVDTNLNSFGRVRSRVNSLVPPVVPSTETTITGNYRAVSSPMTSRPDSYHSENEMAPTGRRRSWMPTIPGKPKSLNVSQDLGTHDLGAWVNAGAQQIIYNSNLLVQGERVRALSDIKALLMLENRYQSFGTTTATHTCISSLENQGAVRNSRSIHSRFPLHNRLHNLCTVIYIRVELEERALTEEDL